MKTITHINTYIHERTRTSTDTHTHMHARTHNGLLRNACNLFFWIIPNLSLKFQEYVKRFIRKESDSIKLDQNQLNIDLLDNISRYQK